MRKLFREYGIAFLTLMLIPLFGLCLYCLAKPTDYEIKNTAFEQKCLDINGSDANLTFIDRNQDYYHWCVIKNPKDNGREYLLFHGPVKDPGMHDEKDYLEKLNKITWKSVKPY